LNIPALLARFRLCGNFGLVALVGVQSNQYPRALDIARPLRAAGISVAIGGFHVSGCLSMLDGHAVGLDACQDLIAIFAGEAEEGRLDAVLRDAAAGRLAPVYNFSNDLPGIDDTPPPFLPRPPRGADDRPQFELRCRPRLPVPVLVLHDHQCPGPQIALSHP
jgi:hypothetical protein